VRKVGRGKYSEVSPQILCHIAQLSRICLYSLIRSSNRSTCRPPRNASSRFSSPSRRRRSSEKSRSCRTSQVVRTLLRFWMWSGTLRYAAEGFQGILTDHGTSCSDSRRLPQSSLNTSTSVLGPDRSCPNAEEHSSPQNIDFKVLYPKFTDFDVRYYILELLKVSVFSIRLIHRD
jgi:hypothetical protein